MNCCLRFYNLQRPIGKSTHLQNKCEIQNHDPQPVSCEIVLHLLRFNGVAKVGTWLPKELKTTFRLHILQ
jgi:hypothetical protein